MAVAGRYVVPVPLRMVRTPISDPVLLKRLRELSDEFGEPPEVIARDLYAMLRGPALMPPAQDSHPWDEFAPRLLTLFAQVFARDARIDTTTPRRKVACFVAQRVASRVVALTTLFRSGMYSEAVPVVRAGYEDWLITAHLLLAQGEDACRDFWYEDQNRLLAKWFKGCSRVMPGTALERYTDPSSKAKFAQFLDARNKELKPFGGLQWAQMAEGVGLADVHECAYTYLSGLAHGSSLNAGLAFDPGVAPRAGRPNPFLRDERREHQPAFWAYWFGLRVLTLAASELGDDIEECSEETLRQLAALEPHPTYVVAVKEQLTKRGGRHLSPQAGK